MLLIFFGDMLPPPLTDAEQYDNGIKLYLDNLHKGYDSLVGVNELKNFLLDTNGKLINNTTSLPWPRTQDLTPLYEINHTMFLAKREVYIEQKKPNRSKTSFACNG